MWRLPGLSRLQEELLDHIREDKMEFTQEIQDDITSLHAENLAFQLILSNVLTRLIMADPKLLAIVAAGFDDAASQAEDFAIKLGKSALPDHTVKAIKIVEQLRAAGGWA
jgi:hypothetical protein